ncbi:hypothetical protein Tco_0614731 [Tanacetum coccineum]
MMKQKEEVEKIGNKNETAKANNEGLMASKPSVSIKYPESIHLEAKRMLKGTDQGHWDNIWVSYAPEVTLNILSLELLERQGFEIVYERNSCRLVYMFKDPKVQNFNEDGLRVMHNKYLEDYFETLDSSAEQNNTPGLITMQDDCTQLGCSQQERKGKIGTFWSKLEEEKEYHGMKDFHPMQPNKEPIQNNDIKIKEEETSSTLSEDLVIV